MDTVIWRKSTQIKKFRNLKATHTSIKENNKKTSTGRGRLCWEYYDIFEDIFAKDNTINFSWTISSFPTLTSTSTSAPSESTSTSAPSASTSTSAPSASASTSTSAPSASAFYADKWSWKLFSLIKLNKINTTIYILLLQIKRKDYT